jgi:hypothetical protein
MWVFHLIVLPPSVAEKMNTMLPGIYDASAYDENNYDDNDDDA